MNYVLNNISNFKCTLDYKTTLKYSNISISTLEISAYATTNIQFKHKTEFLPFLYVWIVTGGQSRCSSRTMNEQYQDDCRYGLNSECIVFWFSSFFHFCPRFEVYEGVSTFYIYTLHTADKWCIDTLHSLFYNETTESFSLNKLNEVVNFVFYVMLF